MSKLHVLATLLVLAIIAGGCKKPKPPAGKTDEPPKAEPKGAPSKAAPAGLAEDKDYAEGQIQAAVLELQTTLDVPGLGSKGAGSAEVQSLAVSDARGKMVFETKDSYVPKGTELRLNPAHGKYVLTAPTKKLYWAMTGSQIGNLLEGGPQMDRSNYSVEVKDSKDKALTIAGVKATRSDALIGFDWVVKTKDGPKKGKVKVKLAIWHSADAKFKPAWGKMMVEFLTVPFQDKDGRKVVDKLKEAVKFPVKWSMEVVNEAKKKKDDKPFKLVTVAQKLEIKELPRAELAAPPAGFKAADGPYNEWGEGGQTISEEELKKIPARKGEPPKKAEPAK